MAKPRLPIDPPLRTRSKTIKHEPSQASDAGAPQEAGSPQRRGVAQALGEKPLNILNVALGDKLIGPSYPSIYREEIVTGEPVETLYICERCFRYSKEAVLLLAHKRYCEFRDTIPGRLVYDEEAYSLYEVDGEEEMLFAQNLSLFCKLFLESKTVCFDVPGFLYYLLVLKPPPPPHLNGTSTPKSSPLKAKSTPKKSPQKSPDARTQDAKRRKPNPNAHLHNGIPPSATPPAPLPQDNKPQIIGFFSKEKMSWNNDNLACILVFPPWQKLGLGQLLMSASYELAKREGRLGGPERPLSKLGAKSYKALWSAHLARTLLAAPPSSKGSKSRKRSIQQLSQETYITPSDIVETLREMQVCASSSAGVDGLGGVRNGTGRDVEVKSPKSPKSPGKRKDGSIVLDRGLLREWCRKRGVAVPTGKVDDLPLNGLRGEFVDGRGDEGSEEEDDDEEDEDSESEEDESMDDDDDDG